MIASEKALIVIASVMLVGVFNTPAAIAQESNTGVAQAGAGYDAALKAYQSYESGQFTEAAVFARTAAELEPENQAYRALLGESLFASGNWILAAEAYETAASLPANAGVNQAHLYRARALALYRGGKPAEAREALAAGLIIPNVASVEPFDWAMIAIAVGDDRTAQSILSDESLCNQFTRQTALDAGYSAKRSHLDERATNFFKLALSLNDVMDEPLAKQTRFGIGREIALLEWPLVISGQISYGDADQTASFLNLPSVSLANIQGGAELGYRVGGWRNGRPIIPFARVFRTEYLASGSSSFNATQGWLGVQHKPFSSINLVVEGSKLFDLGGEGIDDWSLRTAFSYTLGLEPDPVRAQKPFVDIFADASLLVEANETFGLINFRFGRSFRLNDDASPVIVTPFAIVNGSIETAQREHFALGAGGGVGIRKWFANDAAMVTRTFIDLTLQARLGIAGDRRAEGAFATVSFGY